MDRGSLVRSFCCYWDVTEWTRLPCERQIHHENVPVYISAGFFFCRISSKPLMWAPFLYSQTPFDILLFTKNEIGKGRQTVNEIKNNVTRQLMMRSTKLPFPYVGYPPTPLILSESFGIYSLLTFINIKNNVKLVTFHPKVRTHKLELTSFCKSSFSRKWSLASSANPVEMVSVAVILSFFSAARTFVRSSANKRSRQPTRFRNWFCVK